MRPQAPEPTDSAPSQPVSLLSDALDVLTKPGAPEPRADAAKLKELQERTLRNRTRLLDRYHQLPLYGKAREQADTSPRSRWKMAGCPSDHPLVQCILSLRTDEDELLTMREELEAKEFVRLKLAIKTKIADLLLALQKENDQVYREVVDVLEFDQRKTEHSEKMAIAGAKLDPAAKDAELIAAAKAAGIALPGDADA